MCASSEEKAPEGIPQDIVEASAAEDGLAYASEADSPTVLKDFPETDVQPVDDQLALTAEGSTDPLEDVPP